jgi:hypothetical protein
LGLSGCGPNGIGITGGISSSGEPEIAKGAATGDDGAWDEELVGWLVARIYTAPQFDPLCARSLRGATM